MVTHVVFNSVIHSSNVSGNIGLSCIHQMQSFGCIVVCIQYVSDVFLKGPGAFDFSRYITIARPRTIMFLMRVDTARIIRECCIAS